MTKRKDYHKDYRAEYDKRTKYVNVALPMDVYRQLEVLAKREGTKVAPLFRNLALASLHSQVFVPESVEQELKELQFLIRNIANNVNQIAHHSNRVRALVDENGLLMELKGLEDQVRAYTQGRLGKGGHDH